ncbi:MAG: dTDP-4-dehydrorhamnose 3,5-epimerase [Salibacteraceae bacterium]
MKVTELELSGVFLIEPRIFHDDRGYFFESLRMDVLRSVVPQVDFVQFNESKSKSGVIRGLHLQAPPFAQAKLVRAVRGYILDVVVDVRRNSPTYGRWMSVELNDDNKRSLYIPEGFAHGFASLADDTVVQYGCTAYYNKASEMGIRFDDPHLAIAWPSNGTVSEKDLQLPYFSDFNSPF